MIRSIKMGMLGLCLISMLAVSAVVASSASAGILNLQYQECVEVNPAVGLFVDNQCTKELANREGKFEDLWIKEPTAKQPFVGKANGNQTLKAPGISPIICKKLKIKEGNLFGGEHEIENLKKEKFKIGGEDESTVEYEECEVEKEKECKINGEAAGKAKITTNPIESSLAYETEKAAKEEKSESSSKVSESLVLFKPKAKAGEKESEAKTFVIFELSGTCKVKGAVTVEGEVLAKILGHPEEHVVEHEIELTNKKEFWQNNGKEQIVKKITGLSVLKIAAETTGKITLEPTSKQDWWIQKS